MVVWFVGSNPSSKNTSLNVPFHGTKSLVTLMGWIKLLEANPYGMVNVTNQLSVNGKVPVSDYDLANLYFKLKDEKAVVALGNIASNSLKRLGIPHFKLPHPSSRNRKLNDPIFIEEQIATCRAYLEELKCNSTQMD